jgi:hypothetical protein
MIMDGAFNNIDWKYDICLSTEYSLWKFMTNQLEIANKVPLDVRNSSKGGRNQIIFLPQHMTQAQQVFEEFQLPTKSSGHSSMDIDHDEASLKQSNTTYYAEKLEAMLHSNEELDTELPPLTPPMKESKCTM